MKTISQVLSTRNYEKEYQELVSKTVGAFSNANTDPTTVKVTPDLNRIPRKEIEAGYIKEPTTFNLVNVTTQLIMSSGRKLNGKPEDVKFMQDFLDNLGYVGGTMLWEPMLTLIIKHQVMFGNAYLEFITSTEEVNGVKPIIDLDIIDPKQMDYAKDGNGNIVQDKHGPIGYVQTLPDNVGGINTTDYKKYKEPKGVTLTSYQIYIPRERIVHFKLYQTGDTFYPLGFIEPCYNYIMYKLKLETAMMTAILRHGFPTMLGKMGDVNHMPTPNQIQDLLNSMKDMSYKHEIAVPYYVDIKYLESKTVTQLREHLEYFTEQIITSFGVPQAIATSTGDSTNRACYSGDTKVLTDNGWKYYYDVKKTDKIAEFDIKTNNITFKKPKGLFVYDYDGEMYNFTGKSEDILVTPDHRMYLSPVFKNKWYVETAENIKYSMFKFKKNGNWVVNSTLEDRIIIPAINEVTEGRGPYWKRYVEDIEIDKDVFLEFLGYYLSEGGFSTTGKSYTITFFQKGDDKVKKMRACFKKIPLHFTEYFDDKDQGYRWSVSDKRFWRFMKPFGVYCNEKKIVYNKLNKSESLILFKAMMLGDGYWARYLAGGYYSTTSKQLAEDFVKLAMVSGYSANIHTSVDKRPNRQVLYRVNVIKNRNELIHTKSSINKVEYDGKVYCFETESGFFLTMRNGKVAIQGNTLTSSIKVLETTLKMLVTNTVRQMEHNLFMPIARSHGKKSIPSYEWEDVDTTGLKAELEQKKGQEPNKEQIPKKEQKPSEYK